MTTSDLNELRLVSAGHRHDAEVTINNTVFAELIVRTSTAELRNKGILAELSASGGRNIDLRKRAEDAEAKAASVLELHKRVWHTWTELDGRPGAGWICDHCTPTGRVSVVTLHPCPTFTLASGERS